MLDDVEEVLVVVAPRLLRVREVAGPDQEERGAPGTAAVSPVTLGAARQEHALDARGVGPRPRGVEDPRDRRGEDDDRGDREGKDAEGSAHDAEDSTCDGAGQRADRQPAPGAWLNRQLGLEIEEARAVGREREPHRLVLLGPHRRLDAGDDRALTRAEIE